MLGDAYLEADKLGLEMVSVEEPSDSRAQSYLKMLKGIRQLLIKNYETKMEMQELCTQKKETKAKCIVCASRQSTNKSFCQLVFNKQTSQVECTGQFYDLLMNDGIDISSQIQNINKDLAEFQQRCQQISISTASSSEELS